MKLNEVDKQITSSDLEALETFADRIFGKVGIDVEFTRHFLDRVNDARNGKQITASELTRLFKQEYKRWGQPIAQMGPDAEAVMKDLATDINMPFALVWDKENEELDLIVKTVMRKPDFKTSNREFPVESEYFIKGKDTLIPYVSMDWGLWKASHRGRISFDERLSEYIDNAGGQGSEGHMNMWSRFKKNHGIKDMTTDEKEETFLYQKMKSMKKWEYPRLEEALNEFTISDLKYMGITHITSEQKKELQKISHENNGNITRSDLKKVGLLLQTRHVREEEYGPADTRQKRIAIDTVKNPNKALLGGPSASEAEDILKTKFGYSDKDIANLKSTDSGLQKFDTTNEEDAGLYYDNVKKKDYSHYKGKQIHELRQQLKSIRQTLLNLQDIDPKDSSSDMQNDIKSMLRGYDELTTAMDEAENKLLGEDISERDPMRMAGRTGLRHTGTIRSRTSSASFLPKPLAKPVSWIKRLFNDEFTEDKDYNLIAQRKTMNLSDQAIIALIASLYKRLDDKELNEAEEDCSACNGTGWDKTVTSDEDERGCDECGGTGKIEELNEEKIDEWAAPRIALDMMLARSLGKKMFSKMFSKPTGKKSKKKKSVVKDIMTKSLDRSGIGNPLSASKYSPEEVSEESQIWKFNKEDPNNPEVLIQGFGRLMLNQIEDSVIGKLEDLVKRAKGRRDWQQIDALLDREVMQIMIKSIVDTKKDLEKTRKRGGPKSRGINKDINYESKERTSILDVVGKSKIEEFEKDFSKLVKEAGGVGKVVPGVNTSVDVGPNEIKKQAAKFGNDVDKDGVPKKNLR